MTFVRNILILPLALLMLSTAPGNYLAQRQHWSHAQLASRADLIAIAKVISVADAGQDVKDKNPMPYLVAVLITFEVDFVLKGDFKDKTLVLFHYRLKEDASVPINAPGPVPFYSHRVKIQYKGGARSLAKPTYLLFVKSRDDGRYELVSGHTNPLPSARQLIEPLPDTNEKD